MTHRPPSSSHALRRCQQRAISTAAVDAALDWGALYRQRDGRRAFFLGKRAVDSAAAKGVNLHSYQGTAVILASDGTIVTAIRCSDPRRLRRGSPKRGHHSFRRQAESSQYNEQSGPTAHTVR